MDPLSPSRLSRSGAARLLASMPALCALLAPAPAGGVEWLPGRSPYSRPLADPLEPRIGLTYAASPDRLDATLGAPIPLAAFGPASLPLTATLEGHSFFRLGRDGAFFPLQTFDGIFAAGLEARLGFGAARLQLVHWSAHRADGDSTVSYRGMTFSREFWSLDLEARRGHRMLYGGLGASWHSVPEARGLSLRLGAQGSWGDGDWRPFAAVHLAGDAAHRMRFAQTALLGVETGRGPILRLALRGFSGPRPHGQSWQEIERYLGGDFSVSQ